MQIGAIATCAANPVTLVMLCSIVVFPFGKILKRSYRLLSQHKETTT